MTDIVVHNDPAWRERADFIIAARLEESDVKQKLRWEQLWAKQLDHNRFEVCCIPFFIYNVDLGDEVETTDLEIKKYVLNRVLKKSGRFTFRIWLSPAAKRELIIEEIKDLGCLIEERWPGSRLLAIDASDDASAKTLANLLQDRQLQGLLNYETGRT